MSLKYETEYFWCRLDQSGFPSGCEVYLNDKQLKQVSDYYDGIAAKWRDIRYYINVGAGNSTLVTLRNIPGLSGPIMRKYIKLKGWYYLE